MEIIRIPGLPPNPFAKWDTDEIPCQVIAPLVINADLGSTIPARFPADKRATMSTAVDEGMQSALFIACNNNRGIADESRFEILEIGHLGFQGDIAPDWSAENPLLLLGIDRRVQEDLVRNA